MAAEPHDAAPLSESLQKLSVTSGSAKDNQNVKDSWDDDEDESEDEVDDLRPERFGEKRNPVLQTPTTSPPPTSNGPKVPPPTPSTPSAMSPVRSPRSPDFAALSASDNFESFGRSRTTHTSEKRPEKSTATASRMIAAGLGLRPPRRTEEERAYDKAAREREKERREAERKEQADRKAAEEKAKRAMWDD